MPSALPGDAGGAAVHRCRAQRRGLRSRGVADLGDDLGEAEVEFPEFRQPSRASLGYGSRRSAPAGGGGRTWLEGGEALVAPYAAAAVVGREKENPP